MDKQKVKNACIVSAFTVVLFLGLSHFDFIASGFRLVLGLLSPFITAIIVAFILNGVVGMFENKAFGALKRSQTHPKLRKLVRPLAILCTYLLLAAGIALLMRFVIPQLGDSLVKLNQKIPVYLNVLTPHINKLLAQLQINSTLWNQLQSWFDEGVNALLNFAPRLLQMLPDLYGAVASFGGSVFNFIIGVMLSIYLLLGKEQLLSQLSRLNRAFIPAPYSKKLAYVSTLSVKTFSKYITGQLLDAIIIGSISVVFLSIFRFPYAALIGVVMGVTNVIPFFGPFIGAVPGAFILLIENPTRGLLYILFVIVLQQIDGNLIAPKIVGGSVGLPPIWVLFAVMVGGGLFGIPGMVLGTPVFAIFYALLGQATRAHEAKVSKGGEILDPEPVPALQAEPPLNEPKATPSRPFSPKKRSK